MFADVVVENNTLIGYSTSFLWELRDLATSLFRAFCNSIGAVMGFSQNFSALLSHLSLYLALLDEQTLACNLSLNTGMLNFYILFHLDMDCFQTHVLYSSH